METTSYEFDDEAIRGTVLLKNEMPQFTNPIIAIPGASKDGRGFASIDDELLSKHLLLLGGSGCGKTKTFFYIIDQIRKQMNEDDVAIIFDTKGEYYEHFRHEEDIVIGNSHEFRSKSYTWNIFDEILADGTDNLSISINAREIASSLFKGRGSSSQPFFADAARDIFYSILIYFVRQYSNGDPKWRTRLNNKSLVDAFNTLDIKAYRDIFNHYRDFRKFLTYIGDGTGSQHMSNQALGVFGELNSMLSEYFIGIFSDDNPDKRVSFRNAVKNRGGKAIFVEYDLAIGETLSPMYRILVDQALKEALGRGTGESRNGKVFLFADEFKLLPELQHIDDALNFGRGLGLRVIAGIQSIDQLYDIYGEEKGRVLASGFGNIFAYHTNDMSSREYISSRFGTNIMCYPYFNRLENKFVIQTRDGHTVEDWHLLCLKVGQAIIGLCDNPPFEFHFDDYEE